MAASPDRHAGVSATPFALLLGLGLVTALAAVAYGGAAAVYAVADPGVTVRWGIPVLRLVHDVAATITVGLLLVGAFIVPETTRTRRRESAARAAGIAGILWTLAGLGVVVTEFANVAGIGLGDPAYLTQLATFAWSLETSRVGLISAGLAALVALGCFATGSKGGLAGLFFGALLAIAPLALTGHSASSTDHMSGVNALAVHLLTTTVWVGGLVALLALRRQLGGHLEVSVRRYSAVAGWCYALLLGSGLLAAWINVGGLSGLTSRYGVLLGVKALAVIVLGVIGWWHRRRVIASLAAGAAGTRAFTRLALGEVAVMALAVGAGVAVSRTPNPAASDNPPPTSPVYSLSGYPDPGAPTSASWWSAWQIEWLWLTVSIVAVLVYLRWVRRLRRRGDQWPILRTISWVAGWAIFVYATSGAPGVYGRILFSWHMIEHMTVAMIAPLLLVPGAPITLALRALPARRDRTLGPREVLLAMVHSRYLKVLANPAVAASIFFFSLAIFYYSPLFELALRTHTGHVLMMIHFLLSGYVFVWVLIGIDPGPKRWSPLALLVVLFVTISFHAFFGVILTESDSLLAPGFFERLDLPWMSDPLRDQRVGGAIAWGVGEVPTLVLAVTVAVQWMRSDDRETRRRDRAADRDDDAELTAWNDHLARLAERQAPRR